MQHGETYGQLSGCISTDEDVTNWMEERRKAELELVHKKLGEPLPRGD